jgi:hypothetical protein
LVLSLAILHRIAGSFKLLFDAEAQARTESMRDETPEPVPPSAAELLDADDDTAESLVVEYVDEYLRRFPENPFAAFTQLPRGMQYVYATALLEGEVENGGFNQYFYNVSSDYALEALAGYTMIGATEHAKIVRKAIDIFHRERWFHFRVKLRHSLDAFFDSYQYTRLSELDMSLFDLEEDPVALRAEYIRKNLNDFVN